MSNDKSEINDEIDSIMNEIEELQKEMTTEAPEPGQTAADAAPASPTEPYLGGGRAGRYFGRDPSLGTQRRRRRRKCRTGRYIERHQVGSGG